MSVSVGRFKELGSYSAKTTANCEIHVDVSDSITLRSRNRADVRSLLPFNQNALTLAELEPRIGEEVSVIVAIGKVRIIYLCSFYFMSL